MRTNFSTAFRPLRLALVLALLSYLHPQSSTVFAQNTAFTYQGRLSTSGNPANGIYDFRFRLAEDPLANNYVGNPSFTNGIAISGGLFTATLDFGPGIFAGSNYWLEVDVRTNGGSSYTALNPLQPLTPTPYAIFAASSSNLLGALSANQLSGTIPNGNLPVNPAFAGTVSASSFTGGGANVSNVNALTLNGVAVNGFWQLGGNNVGAGQFLGSTNNQPVEIWANNTRVLRVEPDSRGLNAGNLIGGYTGNAIQQPGSGGNVIGGGQSGAPNMIYTNSSQNLIGSGIANQVGPNVNNAVLGGGLGNSLNQDPFGGSPSNSVIAGGFNNTNSETDSVIGGGERNWIQGVADHSVIAGGGFNTITGSYTLPVYAVIGGGSNNRIQTNAEVATIGGGYGNVAGSVASTIAGGQNNLITNNANYESIGGGVANAVIGFAGTVPGGRENVAGGYSFAAGFAAQATNSGSFVWADFSGFEVPFGSLKNNSFSVRANGGVRFVTGGTGITVDGGPLFAGMVLPNDVNHSNIVNVVQGSPVNGVAPGVYGATIAGGGTAFYQPNGPGTNRVTGDFGSIGGGGSNTASYYGTVAGGAANSALNGYSTVAGGALNTASGQYATVGGGVGNTSSSFETTVAGGSGNTASFDYATVAGGGGNSASRNGATVGGGVNNLATNSYATVPGGQNNLAGGVGSFAAGSGAKATNYGAFVWSDGQGGTFSSTTANQFSVRAGGGVQFVTGGAGITVDGQNVLGNSGLRVVTWTNDSPDVINGAAVNYIAAGTQGSVIAGGGTTNTSSYAVYYNSATSTSNSISGDFDFIGGGSGNSIAPGDHSCIVGGIDNSIGAYGYHSFIGGGLSNTVQAALYYGTELNFIGCGWFNTVGGDDWGCVINGGEGNTIGAYSYEATIGGGYSNYVAMDYSVVSGGYLNEATNTYVFIGGGQQNYASGNNAVIGGGYGNTNYGSYGTIPGGYGNVASGYCSFAAGQEAQALHQGAFVWADMQNPVFASTANDQFLVRARGGVGINTASTPDSSFCINTNTYLFSHPIYLRGETGSDHNHGLAYNGNTITNFGTGQFQIDGPVLFGFAGGLLGTRNGGDRAALMWNTTSVGVGTNNPAARLHISSNGSQSSPQLRVDQTTAGDFARIRMVSGTAPGVWDIAAGGGGPTNVMNFFVSPTGGGNGTNILQLLPTGSAILAGTLSQSSDRARKENIKTIDPVSVLAKVSELPISKWNYITEPGVQHVGPMAQDFYAAFNVGADDKHITTVDEGGVALAAIQGLNQKLTEALSHRDAENAELQRKNETLEKRVEALEKIILNSKSN
jgi:hypothetical protein